MGTYLINKMKIKKIFYTVCILLIYSPLVYSQVMINDVYEFPIKQGSKEWKKFESVKERVTALQIPDNILSNISTEGLLETCLNFPYLIDILFYDSYQQGFEALMSGFNGFPELLKRRDLTNVLLEKYNQLTYDTKNLRLKTDIEQGMFSIRSFALVFIFTQDVVLKNMSEKQERQLILLSDEHKKMRQEFPDIFGSFHDIPIGLLHAKKVLEDSKSGDVRDDGYILVTNVKTPNNNTVPYTYIYTGIDTSYTQTELNSLAPEISYLYDGAVIVGTSTKKYNCHGYAWHIYEGGSNAWIGKDNTTAHYAYWEDQSYMPVPEAVATKVVYTGNHSAVRLNSTWYQSKWGRGVLVKHKPNSVPLGYQPTSTKKYYISRSNITSITGSTSVPNGQYATFRANTNSGSNPTNYQWILNPQSNNVLYGSNTSVLDIAFYTAGNYQLVCRAYNAGGWGDYYVTNVNVYNRSSYSIAYPNPASNVLTVSFNPEKIAERQSLMKPSGSASKSSSLNIKLFDFSGTVVYQAASPSEDITIDVSRLRAGNYILHVFDGISDTPEVHKIIIKK